MARPLCSCGCCCGAIAASLAPFSVTSTVNRTSESIPARAWSSALQPFPCFSYGHQQQQSLALQWLLLQRSRAAAAAGARRSPVALVVAAPEAVALASAQDTSVQQQQQQQQLLQQQQGGRSKIAGAGDTCAAGAAAVEPVAIIGLCKRWGRSLEAGPHQHLQQQGPWETPGWSCGGAQRIQTVGQSSSRFKRNNCCKI